MANTITFADKVYLDENPDVPAINKVRDVDMNEIKSVVNTNASETNTNSTNIAGLQGYDLWTNANPTNNFSAQSINLSDSLANYVYYEFIFRLSTTRTQTKSTGKVLNTDGTVLDYVFSSSSLNFSSSRYVNFTTNTKLDIEDSYSSNSGSPVNSRCIPYKVIAYK